MQENTDDLIYRLKERARIRRQISTRKSVQEGAPDRISDLLEEAAVAISLLRDFNLNAPISKDLWETDWDESRVDSIGQNGNDGLHYGGFTNTPKSSGCLESAYDDADQGLEEFKR